MSINNHQHAEEGVPYMSKLCQYLLPIPFFIGIGISFFIAMAGGHIAAKKNIFLDRERFFFKISPEGYVYPTLDNLLQYVRERAPHNKNLILVAGSSILVGVGQQEANLWTKRLQEELGDSYAVVNVSFRAARFNSVGLPLLEILSNEYERCYWVTDVVPRMGPRLLSEGSYNGYNYPFDYIAWQGLLRGLLPLNLARKEDMFSAINSKSESVRLQSQEQIIHALLERVTNSSNLWNFIGYRYIFTIYSPLTPSNLWFWAPRKEIGLDDENPESSIPPVPDRFTRNYNHEMTIISDMFSGRTINQEVQENSDMIKRYFPNEKLRRSTLFLLNLRASYLLDCLSFSDREKYYAVYNELIKFFHQDGFHAMLLGFGYPYQDYVEASHFSNTAAPRMAKEVASCLRTMVKEELTTHENNFKSKE